MYIHLILVWMIIIGFVLAATTLFFTKKNMELNFLNEHFSKIEFGYYSDSEDTSIHVPFSFFISSVSTISFLVVIDLFFINNGDYFVNNIPFVGIYLFYLVLITISLILVHEISISFGRLATTIGKRTKKPIIALAIVISMFAILATAVTASIILSNYLN